MATRSNLGKWDRWYATLGGETRPYGNTESYRLGAEWLEQCALVEDWGAGGGHLTHFMAADRYRGLDGSATPFADEVVDLVAYRSEVPGLFMRHVLEHNREWVAILDNALASFTERMALILFTPLVEETHDLEFEDPPGVPNLAFSRADLEERFDEAGVERKFKTIRSATKYGVETIVRLWR